jgi:hypothetical protein
LAGLKHEAGKGHGGFEVTLDVGQAHEPPRFFRRPPGLSQAAIGS